MKSALFTLLSGLLKYWKSILWFLLIAFSLFSSPDNLPHPGLFHIKQMDKIVHLLLFGCFACIIIHDLYKTSLKLSAKVLIAMFITSLTAAITELIQFFFLENRTGDILDFLADILGVSIGLSGVFLFQYFRFRSSSRKL